MKVLMINDHGFESGGVSSYVINVKKQLEERGHTVKFLSSDVNPERTHFSDFEYEGIINKNYIIRAFYRIFNPLSYLKTRQILKDFKPDLVHLHSMLNYGSPSILYCLKNIPTVMTIHDYYIVGLGFKIIPSLSSNNVHDNRYKYTSIVFYYEIIKNIIRDKFLENINLFIAPSINIKKDFENLGIANSIHVHHGINLFNYSKVIDRNNLLYVGRLSDEKGIEYLLNAMPYIIKRFPAIHLNIIGDGSEKEYFKKIVEQLNLVNNISFIGQASNKKLQNYYKNSTILVVPSICSESFGLVGPEAMSVGRPVIASRVGGIPEWLDDGKTGYLVEPGNPEQIAEKVIKLLSDRKLMELMGKNARKKAEQFSIEKHVDKLEKIYKKVIKKYKA